MFTRCGRARHLTVTPVLPEAVQAATHQVVHHVIAACNTAKHRSNECSLIRTWHGAKACGGCRAARREGGFLLIYFSRCAAPLAPHSSTLVQTALRTKVNVILAWETFTGVVLHLRLLFVLQLAC